MNNSLNVSVSYNNKIITFDIHFKDNSICCSFNSDDIEKFLKYLINKIPHEKQTS